MTFKLAEQKGSYTPNPTREENTKFHEYPSLGSRVVQYGQTDGHDEILRTRLKHVTASIPSYQHESYEETVTYQILGQKTEKSALSTKRILPTAPFRLP